MYPVSTHGDVSVAYPYGERRSSYSGEQTERYGLAGTTLERPRPLEPQFRPALNTAASESSATFRQHEAYHSRPSASSAFGPDGRNLPAFKDIFKSPAPAKPSYSEAQPWSPYSSTISAAYSNEAYHRTSTLRSPLALPHNPEMVQRQPPAHGRVFDVPVLDTSPVSRQPLQSLPVSPYAGQHDAGRTPAEVSRKRASRPLSGSFAPSGATTAYHQLDIPGSSTSTSSFLTTNASSPYQASAVDSQRDNRSELAKAASNASYSQGGAESHGKCVEMRDVPGEGRFFIYEDGHRIPTQVDGEQVNPQWGLTKANKPRRRLALACLDCREKKIKCEPGQNRCVQCEKAMRPCRR